MFRKITAMILGVLSVLSVAAFVGPVAPAAASAPVSPTIAQQHPGYPQSDCRIPNRTKWTGTRMEGMVIPKYSKGPYWAQACTDVHISDTGRYFRFDWYAQLFNIVEGNSKTCIVWDTPGNGFNGVVKGCDGPVADRWYIHGYAGFDRYIHGNPKDFAFWGVIYDRRGYSRKWVRMYPYYYAWNQ